MALHTCLTNHAQLKRTLNDKQRIILVAIDEEEVIGFIHGFVKDEAGTIVRNTVLMLDAMYVKEKNRNQGVGTSLVEEFRKWGKSVDAKFIDLTVLIDNYSAIELYKKQAFNPLKSHMRSVLE
ncbi:MAG: GCN5-related N-acetyltransferase [Anaerocolumna sp.]|nr:GCN5-related N-acetyltransferase [Anaerocolumna sp.]